MRANVTRIIGFLAAITLALAAIAPHLQPSEKHVIVLFGLAFPYLFLFALITLAFTWKKNKIAFAALFILIVVTTRDFMSYIKPSWGSTSATTASDLQVLSFNGMMGVKLVDEKHVFNKKRQALFDALMHQEHVPDIICAQEVNGIVDHALLASFDYPYYHKIEKRGAVILSKYPMIKKGTVDFGARLNSCLWADIVIPSKAETKTDTIRVYSVHFESNRLSQSSYEFLAKEEYEGAEAIAGIKDLLIKYPKYATRRGKQALKVRTHILKSPHPVILAGDFNDPPMSYTYHVFQDLLRDSFVKKGSGLGTTWIGAIPMLRIDYILSSPEIEIVDFQCLKSNLSDHYPVKASYRL